MQIQYKWCFHSKIYVCGTHEHGSALSHKEYLENKSTNKIKIFMWFLHRGVILTKDNLTKRNWQCCKNYYFCDQEENIPGLFLSCPFASVIWRMIQVAYNLPPLASITKFVPKLVGGCQPNFKGTYPCGSMCLFMDNLELS